jgi:hypothetical protein
VAQHFDSVVVDIAKLRDYCLSESHPRGRHKARVFRTALGLTAADAEVVRESLLSAVRDRSDKLQATESDAFGQRHEIDFEMTTAVGTATVRSAWIVPSGQRVLRLITC